MTPNRFSPCVLTIWHFRLKTWTRQEGTIRLSIDDGPPATEFIRDDDDDESTHGLEDDEPLADLAQRLTSGSEAEAPQTPPIESIRHNG